jgi:hypothetical protein
MPAPLTFLCLASYHKGFEFLRELRRQGCRVLLVTSKSLEREEWPRESIDEMLYIPDEGKQWNPQDTLLGISYAARTRHFDRIVPLDDFDVEKAAALREHLRMPGMGETHTRFFRDKLAIVWKGKVVRATASRYGMPPFTVSHGGGVFTSRLIERGSPDETALRALNASVLAALGLDNGVSHTEYIRAHDGRWLFLETSARVGGAHIAELVEIATGANLWAEWAKVEVAAARGEEYTPPPDRGEYAGLAVSLARQESPDTSAYADPEIAWRLSKHHHVGFIVRSPDVRRVESLLDSYVPRIAHDFGAALPMTDSPAH